MLASILDVAGDVGLPAIFLLVSLESMGIPLPGETALITGAILASHGSLSIEAVIALAAAGAILGDNVGYAIGRRFGRRLLEAPGPFEKHRRAVITYGQPFFDKHGPKAVFLGRWFAGLRITAAWLAGVNRMHWPAFLFWNASGGIAWATVVGILAYSFGHAAERAIEKAGLFGGIAVVVIGVIVWLVIRRQTHRAPVEGDEGAMVAEAEDRLDEAKAS